VVALYVLLGLATTVVLARITISSVKTFYGNRPSIERYHHAMDLLGEMAEHTKSDQVQHQTIAHVSERTHNLAVPTICNGPPQTPQGGHFRPLATHLAGPSFGADDGFEPATLTLARFPEVSAG
jgi:hypothetical protein